MPQTRLVITIRPSSVIADRVSRGELDLGIVTLPVPHEDLEEEEEFDKDLEEGLEEDVGFDDLEEPDELDIEDEDENLELQIEDEEELNVLEYEELAEDLEDDVTSEEDVEAEEAEQEQEEEKEEK